MATRFQLEEIISDTKVALDFCSFVKSHGFAIVSVTKEYTNVYDRMFDLMAKWYGKPMRERSQFTPYDPLKEVGYYKNSGLAKEFFAVRNTSANTSIYWPSDPPEFGEAAIATFQKSEQLAKLIVGILSLALHVDASKFIELCDQEPLPLDTYATSMLHLFNYYGMPPNDSLGTSCTEHTDSGLVTLIPCARVSSGLECLDWSKFEWVDLEKEAMPNDVVVMCGETLARLTCNYYQGTVHRVMSRDKQRLSIPFQLRGRPDAIIDSLGLKSDVIKVPKSLEERITIKEFIQ